MFEEKNKQILRKMNTIFDAFEYIENLTVSNFSVGVNEYAEHMCFSQIINSNKIEMHKVLSMPNLSLQVRHLFL